ncbi:hypothetical protein VNO77_31912 [Canavalia gladiata]|uniref:Phosphatidylinositol-specific phospholipase C X domain-containing protein n=1 Tax=Canavalia gladiata TaxID=3824 RepID=A0AAN9Q3X4_CANGL
MVMVVGHLKIHTFLFSLVSLKSQQWPPQLETPLGIKCLNCTTKSALVPREASCWNLQRESTTFSVEFQGEEYGHATNKHAEAIIDRFQRRGLHVEAFFLYLLSDDHKVHHDMKFPLAHYFQYTCNKSSFRIIKALKKGVRVIELNIWSDTSFVKLKACLNAIKEYAFYASPYPVAINYDANMDKMVDDVFGEMLFRADSNDMKEFPSPEN